MPQQMLRGVFRPTKPKDRFRNVGSSDNCIEIRISSVTFNFLEYCMLPVIKESINLSTYQFGYSEKTSTKLAVTLFKETQRKYIDECSSLYACYFDLSKGLERRMQPISLVSFNMDIFRCTFANSEICVNCKASFPGHWTATKGARQGGVISAYMFFF